MTNNLSNSKSGLIFSLSDAVFVAMTVLIISLVVLLPIPATAQEDVDISSSLREAKSFCAKMTDENKRMARAAGYDIGKLCNSLKSLGSLSLDQEGTDNEADELIQPRKDKQGRAAKYDRKSDARSDRKLDRKSDRKSLADDEMETDREEDRDQYDDDYDQWRDDEDYYADDLDEDLMELQPFGYELFAGEPTTFTPANQIPVSPDYLLGPGDNLNILFYGKTNESVSLEINRNGAVDFPQLGPVNLTGMTFVDAKTLLQERIAEEMLGVQASISLGELRSIQIFVLGEAYKPGAYTVSALSTITNALFLSGGVSDIASLRNIQLKRGGDTIATLDLYELLLDGDTSNDQRLQASDVIYIPTVGNTASVDGEVKRPAIYELKGATTVKQLVAMAGGMQPTAYPNRATIQRSDADGFMTVVDLDLTAATGLAERVGNGDLLIIDSVVERKEAVVTLSGHVYRPGEFRWKSGLRVTDLVKDVRQLRSDGDLDFALIRREIPPIGLVLPIFVNLGAALENRGGDDDILLAARDELMVFSREEGRAEILRDLVDELKLQARSGKMADIVSVTGTVRSPGDYPLTKNMTVTQLIAAAGGLEESAYTSAVELSRYDLSNPEQASSAHFPVDLTEAYADTNADVRLQSYDVLSVRTIPEFRESLSVTLEGEVRFPGDYSFTRGETLGDVIRRAGGLNRLAHAEAAVFTREDLRLQEAKKLEQLQERLKADIATAELENANDGNAKGATAAADKLLETLDASEAVGRLVIDLEGILDGRLEDVQLKDGDMLVIPEYRQEISVLGEVQQPTAHLYNSNLKLRDYIDLSGGTKESADQKRIYVVKANGAVALPGRSGWLSRKRLVVEAGDTIIVPIDADKQKTLTVWAEASQIVYQLALGAAAFNNLNN